jgi:carboxyl-terminal processing protease
MTFKRSFLITLLVIFSVSAGFAAGFLAKTYLSAGENEWPILNQAYQILQDHGYKDLPPAPILEYGMIRGLVQAYNDPYTIFVEPPQHELEGNVLHGSFGGIGVRLGKDPEGFVVLYPYPESPAFIAGIQEGDRLLEVDGLQITGETPMDTIEAALRGPVGERIAVTIARRPDFTPLDVQIKLGEIPLPSVTWHLDLVEPRLGIIEVNIIASSTPDEIQKAVKDLQSRGATAVALDLRDNFGGLLTAGVDTARLFLREGTVIQQQFRGEKLETYRVEQAGSFADLPLAVFVNQHTASAAEIVAGALKAQGRAQIIGTPTFGKDTVQFVFDLQDGSSLHVTAAHWWVPGLEPPLAGNGILPDLSIQTVETGRDAAVDAAIGVLFGAQ